MKPFAEGEVVRVSIADWMIQLEWAPRICITQEAAETAMAEVNRLSGTTRRPMLVNMAEVDSVTRAARHVFTIPCAASIIALVGRSPVDRVIANFILGVSRLPTPTKFFNSESEATAWLEEARDAPAG